MRLFDDLHKVLACGSAAVVISLDISAAFDTIDHQMLLSRLELNFGVTGVALNWFQSYLSDRSQAVYIGQTSSSIFPLTCGIPQGSVLGPVLFSLYTSPLANVIKNCEATPSAYADDVNIASSIDPRSTNCCAAEMATTDVSQWYRNNGMMLNAAKSEALLVGTRHQLAKFSRPITVRVDNQPIQCKNNLTTLGVVVDSELSLADRINSLVSSCNYHLRAFRRLRPMMSSELSETVGRAIVLSRLDYCNALLYGIPESQLDRLQRIQNQCARIIATPKPREDVKPALASLHWLPVRERIEFKVASLTYSALHDSSCSYLTELLTKPAVAARSLRSSDDCHRLIVPRTKTKFQDRPFSVSAPTVWNSLPTVIRASESMLSFKPLLKTYLYNRVYASDM